MMFFEGHNTIIVETAVGSEFAIVEAELDAKDINISSVESVPSQLKNMKEKDEDRLVKGNGIIKSTKKPAIPTDQLKEMIYS